MEEKRVFTTQNYELEAPIKDRTSNKSKRKSKTLFIIALLVFALTLALLCATFIYLDSFKIIPGNMFMKILVGTGGFALLETVFVCWARHRRFAAITSIVMCVVVIAAAVFGVYAFYKLIESMNNVEEPKTYYAYVGIYTNKNSKYVSAWSGSEHNELYKSNINIEDCIVGTMLINVDNGYSSQAIRMYRKEHRINVKAYDDFGSMVDALRNGEIEAILYNEAYMEIFLGDNSDFYDWAVEIDRLGVETEHTAKAKKADVVSEPFIVYVSGLDTSNEDSFPDRARSDVNIVAAVDPVKKKILLINTPRDYYVPLWGKSYAMDKLTHAGVYGIGCSIQTLENLYDVEFNYYVRTNVHSLVKVVDALGGITVHSDYEFYTSAYGANRQFYIGENELDGEGALAFIREREAFANGDKQRGIHQQEVIRAIIEKACSPAIVAHFSDILDVVSKSVQTNVGKEEIYALIRMQLSDMASWTVESLSVDGYGSMEHSYAIGMGYDPVWVMIPYANTVKEAKDAMKEFCLTE